MFKALKPSTRVLELYCKGYMSVSWVQHSVKQLGAGLSDADGTCTHVTNGPFRFLAQIQKYLCILHENKIICGTQDKADFCSLFLQY